MGRRKKGSPRVRPLPKEIPAPNDVGFDNELANEVLSSLPETDTLEMVSVEEMLAKGKFKELLLPFNHGEHVRSVDENLLEELTALSDSFPEIPKAEECDYFGSKYRELLLKVTLIFPFKFLKVSGTGRALLHAGEAYPVFLNDGKKLTVVTHTEDATGVPGKSEHVAIAATTVSGLRLSFLPGEDRNLKPDPTTVQTVINKGVLLKLCPYEMFRRHMLKVSNSKSVVYTTKLLKSILPSISVTKISEITREMYTEALFKAVDTTVTQFLLDYYYTTVFVELLRNKEVTRSVTLHTSNAAAPSYKPERQRYVVPYNDLITLTKTIKRVRVTTDRAEAEYHKEKWDVIGFPRTLKSGKVIQVKPHTKHRRKPIEGEVVTTPKEYMKRSTLSTHTKDK